MVCYSEDDKTFILNYNRAVRHNKKLPALPKGITIEEKEDTHKRRVRHSKASDYFNKRSDKEKDKEEIKNGKLSLMEAGDDDWSLGSTPTETGADNSSIGSIYRRRKSFPKSGFTKKGNIPPSRGE